MDGSINGVEYALTATVKTPGSGQSSRWHANYSVCDSCYQQRNKGLACLCCGRAYRHSAQREMMQCSTWVLPGPNDDQTSSAAEKKKRVALALFRSIGGGSHDLLYQFMIISKRPSSTE